MKWWNPLWPAAAPDGPILWFAPNLLGWKEDNSTADLRIWRDADGAVLSLAVDVAVTFDVHKDLSDETEVRRYARGLAESRSGGLIEAHARCTKVGPTAFWIYKRLEVPAYIYTGMLMACAHELPFLWTVVDGEGQTTGIREAVVTAGLLRSGKLTPANYEQCWAHDPYDPAYRGVDRRVLRGISDDACYDAQFPEHPLSKVRRVLAALPDNMEFDAKTSGSLLQ